MFSQGQKVLWAPPSRREPVEAVIVRADTAKDWYVINACSLEFYAHERELKPEKVMPPVNLPRFSVTDKTGKNVYDDDFGYDAMLRISGDFATDERRHEYASAVVAALNAATIPTPETSLHPLSEDSSHGN